MKEKLFILSILIIMLLTMPFTIKRLFLNSKAVNFSYDDYEITKTSESANKPSTNSYFDDALFIGDSRTVGLRDFGTLDNATFFATVGMTVQNVMEEKVNIKDFGELTLEKLLSQKQFKKIYVMLGINEMYKDLEPIIDNYKRLISYIQNKQIFSIIYIQANLHVNENIYKSSQYINNPRIDKFNYETSKLANEKNILYLNINEYFDQEDGQLNATYTSDGAHVFPIYYKDWCSWIKRHTK